MQQVALAYARGAQAVVTPSGVAILLPTSITPKLLKRLVELWKDAWFLSQNEDGDCWAGNRYFSRRKGCDPATVRFHFAILEALGWGKREIRGPQRRFRCSITPADLVHFLPHFARLLRPILRAFRLSVPVSHDSEIHTNTDRSSASSTQEQTARPRARRRDAPPLSPEESAVVVEATEAVGEEMPPATLADLVRKVGAACVREALLLLSWRVKRGKAPDTRGGFLRAAAEGLKAGTWTLPQAVLRAADEAERKAERDRVAASRTIADGQDDKRPGGVQPPPPPPDNRDEMQRAWDALPPGEQQAILEAALADLLAEPLPPPVRAMIERRGVEHDRVQANARRRALSRAEDAAAATKTGGTP